MCHSGWWHDDVSAIAAWGKEGWGVVVLYTIRLVMQYHPWMQARLSTPDCSSGLLACLLINEGGS